MREVWAADFRDRIVHHLLINFIEPIFELKFIFHSYACRKNKGAHLAIHHLKKNFGILRIYLRPVNKHYEYFVWDEGIKNKKQNC